MTLSVLHSTSLFHAPLLIFGILLTLSLGANDARKAMGIIVMGLVILGFQEHFYAPNWMMIISAIPIGQGKASGGRRIIHTWEDKWFYRIRPVHSFISQLASSPRIRQSRPPTSAAKSR